jgi:hypothetical protein
MSFIADLEENVRSALKLIAHLVNFTGTIIFEDSVKGKPSAVKKISKVAWIQH